MTNIISLPALNVLLADDNSANCLIAETILERAGHKVEIEKNGLLALNQTKKAAYDLVILDIKMPVMDGIEALRRIRAEESENQDTIILALSAYSEPKDRKHFLSVGFDAVLSKPLRTGDLEKAIQKFQGGKQWFEQKTKTHTCTKHIQLLDNELIKTLTTQHGLAALLDIQTRYWTSIREHCNRLKLHLPTALEGDENGLTELRRAAHMINVTSASIGLTRVGHICRNLRNAPRVEISGLMQDFIEALGESQSVLSHALSRTRKLNPAVQMRREHETEPSHNGENNRSAIGN